MAHSKIVSLSEVRRVRNERRLQAEGLRFARQWHSYCLVPDLRPGVDILVTGGDQRVAIRRGDTLSIERADWQRSSARVIAGGADVITVIVDGRRTLVLKRRFDVGGFDNFKLSDGFTRQVWTVRFDAAPETWVPKLDVVRLLDKYSPLLD